MNSLPTYWIYKKKMEIEIFSANDPNSPQRNLFVYVHVRVFFIAYYILCIVLIKQFHCWYNIWSDRTCLKPENWESNAKYKLYTIDQRKFEKFFYNCEGKKSYTCIKQIFPIILIRKNWLLDLVHDFWSSVSLTE